MDASAEEVIRALIQAARGGDTTAIRLVLERVAPLPRNRPVQFDMPAIETAEDLGEAMSAILQAAGDGAISPDEAVSIASLVEMRRKTLETLELERRILALEQSKETPG
jgi:small-conductance mechanosensitive channel